MRPAKWWPWRRDAGLRRRTALTERDEGGGAGDSIRWKTLQLLLAGDLEGAGMLVADYMAHLIPGVQSYPIVMNEGPLLGNQRLTA